MWPDQVSNPGPLTYESGALLIALCGPAQSIGDIFSFRIYDTYFLHDVRGHSARVTLPRSTHVDLVFSFFTFAIFL